jgi:hypothetical protein
LSAANFDRSGDRFILRRHRLDMEDGRDVIIQRPAAAPAIKDDWKYRRPA